MSNPNQPQDPRLRDIFLKAVDITDTGRRESFLDGVCAADPALRIQIDALLASHQKDSFLEHPAIQLEPKPTPDSAEATTLDADAAESARTVISPRSSEPGVPENIRYFGDYEVLGEIARGGMGVVYRARQKSLNRIVALKMIRAGRLADDAEVKRFRTEAEAAANLQHPNIVAIHEIGEHEGQHYFSMDYVEGNDLAQLVAGGPLPTAQAARYVKTIAEAISYAHQRGTLHRDLKPHNVLIDQHDEPRITDFGLAKLTKHDSSLTQEGAVMGSPSYMPPEQASGKLLQVGPHSDVYSLGAVLYHLLTGQAPFKGETAVATLRQVLEDEPTPPSKLNPKVPEDLETICLKCLQKGPSQRYATADELVEELGRFLNFEPILASPASGWRRTWSWAQNNPWVFAGAFASLVLLFACVAYGMFERARFVTWQTTHMKRVQEVADSPSLLFFQVFPLIMAVLYLDGKVFRRNHRQHSSGRVAPSTKHLWLHVSLGSLGIAAGLAALGLQIRSWAWSSSVSPMLLLDIISVICALGLNWLGFHRVWEAVGMHDTSRFRVVVDKVLERQLAVEWRRWSPLKLVGFAFWLCLVCGGLILLVCACWVLSTSALGLSIAVIGCLMSIGLVKLTAWVVRQRRRLFTYLFAPMVFASSLFALGALAVGSFAQTSKTDPKMVIAVFLCCLNAAALVYLGLFFFRGTTQTQTGERRRFPVNPWLDTLLGAALFVVVAILLHTEENWRGRHEWARAKAELAAKGESVDYESFHRSSVPDAENVMAHPYMKKHFLRGTPNFPIVHPGNFSELTALQKLPRQTDPKVSVRAQKTGPSLLQDTSWVPGERGWTVKPEKTDPSSLQKILDEYARGGEFALLEDALQRPQSRLDWDPYDPWGRFNSISFYRVAQAYAPLCKIHLLMGQTDTALKDLLMLRRLMESVPCSEPPTTVASRVKVRLTENYAHTLEETLAAELWPNPYLEQVQRLCEGVDLLSDVGRSMRGERTALLLWTESLGKGLKFGLLKTSLSESPGLIMMAIMDGWVDQERANFVKWSQVGLEGLDVTRQRLDAHAIDAGDKFLRKSSEHQPRFHRTLAAGIMSTSFVHVYQRTARTQTLLDQASVACGLERFRAANGVYPETLEALVPQLASKLPHDIFDGHPLRYRRTDDGRYLLYSIGWNSKDDDGKMEPLKEGEPIADWGFDNGDQVWKGVPKR